MLKAFISRSTLQNYSFSVVQLSQSHFSSNRGRKRTGNNLIKYDAPLQPLKLAYNSYENLTRDPGVPPVLIMHGVSVNSFK